MEGIIRWSSCLAMALFVFLGDYQGAAAGNPCCSFPCQHRGICMTTGHDKYICDCANTGFMGPYCEVPDSWGGSLKHWITPSPDTINNLLTRFNWLWEFINSTPFLQRFFMRKVYTVRSETVDSPPLFTSGHSYITLEAANNKSYFARALPPIPENCPTPMGVAGKKTLPPLEDLRKLFQRRKFIPEEHGSNQLFTFFAQHFTHIFFKTDIKRGTGQFTWGGDGIDTTSIHGPDVATELALRTFKNGKMKTQVINGEEYPPYLKDAPVHMRYPDSVPMDKRFALGHEFFGMIPGLFLYSTIWIREHNRICDVLQEEHPEWGDEQLFQTTKLIILGEIIKIVIVDYVQHLSQYKFKLTFDPELLFGEVYQYQNRINLEFDHLYHWHPLIPDSFHIGGVSYPVEKFLFNNDIIIKNGIRASTEAFMKQRAGKVTSLNHHKATVHVALETIQHGRDLRVQSLNNYRRRFKLPPYTSFEGLTGEKEVSAELERLYGDIEAVELYVGMMMERHRVGGMFGATIIEVGGPFSVKGLLSNPICSPLYWRPSTFGGEKGFNIVKEASLEKLFCLNMENCPRIAFTVPEGTPWTTPEPEGRGKTQKHTEL